MTKNILIAGGAGFIGSHLCERLLKQEANVICLDDLSTSSGKNIFKIFAEKNFKFVQANVRSKINEISALNIKFHEIYNLACAASPDFYQKKPIVTLKTSIDGSLNLLELARKNQSKYFFFPQQVRSMEILKNILKKKHILDVNPVGKRACYDEGKRVERVFSNRLF